MAEKARRTVAANRRTVYALLLCMVFAGLACAAPDEPPRYGLTIRAGLPLDEALQELAHQTGIQVVFFSQITAGHRAPEVSGQFTLAGAMNRLLEGSDLTFRQVNERTIEVRQAPPRAARSSASAPATVDSMQEVRVVATVEQLVATRIPTPLHDIPQSISVISNEQIRQQSSFELADVMRNTPGIATRRTTSLDESAYSRAFAVTTYHVDGGGALRPALTNVNLFQGTPDLSEFDRVEVLRGSDALFTGNSNPGGTVSLVRKRPLATSSFKVAATLGSWNNYRVELDATGPLTEDGALRGRADAVYATRGYFFDRAHLDRKKVFAALEYDFTPNSTLTVGGSYQWDEALPLGNGLPLYSDGSDPHFPRSTGLVFDWAYYNTRVGQAYLQFRQQFAEDWNLKINASAGRTNVEHGTGEFTYLDKRTQTASPPSATFGLRPDRFRLSTVDATLTGQLDWFGLHEVIAIGGDLTRLRGSQVQQTYTAFGPPLTNVRAFDPAAYPDPRDTKPPTFVVDVREALDQHGAFVSLQVDLNDALSVTGGARISSDSLEFTGSLSFAGIELPQVSNESGSSDVMTPYAALMYRINEHLSWYASYADVYLTLGGPPRRADGRIIGPAHGVNIETGLKGVWREGALNASLVAYRIQQRHLPVQAQVTPAPNCCFVDGSARSRGVDLEVNGELAPGWLIGSGYTYNEHETADGGIPSTSTPRHQLKLWTSKTLPGALSRWNAGGSLRAQTSARGSPLLKCDAQFQNCVATEVVGQKEYAVLDLRAAYEVRPNWEVALSANNVFDKRYYLSQDTPAATVWYGEPRNFMLRIDAEY